ncbi:hypothetical protein ACV07N_13280 [Roseivirga echinicomitans]
MRLVGIILLVFSSFGQVQSTKPFEVESFEIVIKAMNSFMLDYEQARIDQSKSFTDAERKGHELLNKYLNKEYDSLSIIKSQQEIEEILRKNDWSKKGILVFEKLISNRKNELGGSMNKVGILANVDISIPDIKQVDINQRANWNSLKQDISQQVKPKIEASIPASNIETSSQEQKNQRSQPSNWVSILIRVLVVIIVFLLGFLIGSKQRASTYKAEYHRLSKKYNEKKSQLEVQNNQLQRLKDKHENEVQSLKNQSLRSPKEIDHALPQSNDVIPKPDNEIKDIASTITKAEEDKPKVFYFQYPETDGSFKKSQARSNVDTDSIYEITIKEGQKEALLNFVANQKNHIKILSMLNETLVPVCEVDNPSKTDKPTSIQIIKPGKLVITDDKFHINGGEKLKLRVS